MLDPAAAGLRYRMSEDFTVRCLHDLLLKHKSQWDKSIKQSIREFCMKFIFGKLLAFSVIFV